MLFNLDKCKVPHLGNNNGNHKYQIGEEIEVSG